MSDKELRLIIKILTEMANTAHDEGEQTGDPLKAGTSVGLGLAVVLLTTVQDEVQAVEG